MKSRMREVIKCCAFPFRAIRLIKSLLSREWLQIKSKPYYAYLCLMTNRARYNAFVNEAKNYSRSGKVLL